MVAAGATQFIVMLSLAKEDLSARIIPTSYMFEDEYVSEREYGLIPWQVYLTANLDPLYTGSDCSGAYAVALEVITMLP